METAKGISVIGSGYVGTVVAVCLANLGHQVVGVEIDQNKLEQLRRGILPFYETGLEPRLKNAVASGQLIFTDDYQMAMDQSEVVFLCVDTPLGSDGHPEMSAVESAARSIGAAIRDRHVVVTKSTVPVGTGSWLETTIESALPEGVDAEAVCIVSSPEFLREGSAVRDFLHPERIVVGGDDPACVNRVAGVYRKILEQSFDGGRPESKPALIKTGRTTAETIKYAANAFLATKISFINEIANICEPLGADVTEVAYAIGLDSRIGHQFLNAGVGWGGSCFDKDTAALAATARDRGIQPLILDAVRQVNSNQRHLVVHKLHKHLRRLHGQRIALLGLAFKPGTDDTRDSPAITIAHALKTEGAHIRASDPMVTAISSMRELAVVADPFEAIQDADAVVLLTAWPEYIELDFVKAAERMHGTLVIDGRNALNPETIVAAGLIYEGMGRHSSLD